MPSLQMSFIFIDVIDAVPENIFGLLKRSYLMFPKTLNVPSHSGEKYMIVACIISHVAAQMKLYMLIACLCSNSHRKSCTKKSWRRRSRRQVFYMHRLLCDFKTIHAISMYNFICAATCEIMHAIIMYCSPPWGGTFNVLGNIR